MGGSEERTARLYYDMILDVWKLIKDNLISFDGDWDRVVREANKVPADHPDVHKLASGLCKEVLLEMERRHNGSN